MRVSLCLFTRVIFTIVITLFVNVDVSAGNEGIGQPKLGVYAPFVEYPKVGINVLGNSQYIYAAVGSKVRVSTANSIVTKANLDTGSDTTQTTRDWAHSQGLPNDDAGHILANRMGGSGKDPVNIFPQNLSVNRGAYRVFEGHIADCVANTAGVTATLDWTFTYTFSNDTRPNGVTYCVNYDKTPVCATAAMCQKFTN